MKEFLVELTTTVPEGTDPAEVDRRRADESARARELAAAGHLVRLWRPVGELRSIGLWRAADEGELYGEVLGTLPLWPWMTSVVTPWSPTPTTRAGPPPPPEPHERGSSPPDGPRRSHRKRSVRLTLDDRSSILE